MGFKLGSMGATTLVDNLTMCSQVGWDNGVWYLGVFPYCMHYQRHTSFLPYAGFHQQVACLPWYKEGEVDPGVAFELLTSIAQPQCPDDCVSSITYTRDTGPEQHGRCYGCRGTCLCDKYWGGEGCQAAECINDNCMGHGVCTTDGIGTLDGYAPYDCVCDPEYSGVSCADKME